MRSLLVLAVVALAAVACDRGTPGPHRDSVPVPPVAGPVASPATAPAGNLVFLDNAGSVVATADLQLPRPLPPAGRRFHGTWRLLSFKKGFPSASTRPGAYSGDVSEEGVSIDLNPGTADSNVVLGGDFKDGSMTGTWYHATFAGGKSLGTFSLTGPVAGGAVPPKDHPDGRQSNGTSRRR
jgi:hypothetical protein